MDNNRDRKFLLYLTGLATLGIAYWAIDKMSKQKPTNSKPLSLEKTRKILQ